MLDALLQKIIKPSTRAFWREARARRGGSLLEALHGLFYLKWPEFYIRVGLGRSRPARLLRAPARRIGKALGLWGAGAGERFADTYHGKVMPLAEATRLIRIGRPVHMRVPETVLPYHMARDIIVENPDALALLRCPCRATAAAPCLPMDVCILVGRHVVDFVLDHHPKKSRRITADEAVEVVSAARKRGHVSHAFFKEAVLGRYYAICNCCSCCCGAMQAQREGVPMLASSGYLARVTDKDCVGCGLCAKKCPFAAITMVSPREAWEAREGQENRKLPCIAPDRCLGCGVCVQLCPQKALSLESDPAKPAPLLLRGAASCTEGAGGHA